MARSRRPELEKDNPVAPQAYVSRRRHRSKESQDRSDVVSTLHKLTDAAEHFVSLVPRRKRTAVPRQKLLDAITHAQSMLLVVNPTVDG